MGSWNIFFFKEQIIVEKGEPRTHLHEVQTTGEKLEVSFCRDCGSQFFVEPAGENKWMPKSHITGNGATETQCGAENIVFNLL